MTFKSRRIFKTGKSSQDEIRELLQFVFVGELLMPSEYVWLITPWISNVPLIDNSAGLFSTLDPLWGHREIRLNEIVVRLISLNVTVIVVTRPDEHCKEYMLRLQEEVDSVESVENLKVYWKQELHTKGILTDTSLLTGSMNLTNNGLDLLDEQVTFDTDAHEIAQGRINFESYMDKE